MFDDFKNEASSAFKQLEGIALDSFIEDLPETFKDVLSVVESLKVLIEE